MNVQRRANLLLAAALGMAAVVAYLGIYAYYWVQS